MNVVQRFGQFAAAIGKSWFSMTRDEQRAVALIVSLFLLGLAVHCGRMLFSSWNEQASAHIESGEAWHE